MIHATSRDRSHLRRTLKDVGTLRGTLEDHEIANKAEMKKAHERAFLDALPASSASKKQMAALSVQLHDHIQEQALGVLTDPDMVEAAYQKFASAKAIEAAQGASREASRRRSGNGSESPAKSPSRPSLRGLGSVDEDATETGGADEPDNKSDSKPSSPSKDPKLLSVHYTGTGYFINTKKGAEKAEAGGRKREGRGGGIYFGNMTPRVWDIADFEH